MERPLQSQYAVRGDPCYGERIQCAELGPRTTTTRTSTRTSPGRGPGLPTVRGDVNFGILILK
jgi:hypothetical protein